MLGVSSAFIIMSPLKRSKIIAFTASPSTKLARTSLSAIPDEYRGVITEAEGKTAAAGERKTRLFCYGAGTGLSITLGVVSAAAMGGNPSAIVIAGNLPGGVGIGGCAIDALLAAFFGTFVYLELQTAEQSRERIYDEMMKRSGKGVKKNDATGVTNGKDKKKRKKGGKRGRGMGEIAALSEEEEKGEVGTKGEGGGKKSIMDTAKDFYKQADDMAASQALLLNKELEERGVLEKITDDTGLKVVDKVGVKTGWADPEWNWGSAAGKAHDLAMELRGRLNKSEGARIEWLKELVDDEGKVEEAKLALGLRVQRARWQNKDGDGRGWTIMEGMVDLKYEGDGAKILGKDCNDLAEYCGGGNLPEGAEGGNNEVGVGIARGLCAMGFVEDGL